MVESQTLTKANPIKEETKDIKEETSPSINNTEEIANPSIKVETSTITSLSTKEAITSPSIRITSPSTSTDCLFKIFNKMIIKLFVRIELICFLTDFSLFPFLSCTLAHQSWKFVCFYMFFWIPAQFRPLFYRILISFIFCLAFRIFLTNPI